MNLFERIKERTNMRSIAECYGFNTVSPQVRAEVEAMVDEYRTRYNSGTEPTEQEKAKNIFELMKKATERR